MVLNHWDLQYLPYVQVEWSLFYITAVRQEWDLRVCLVVLVGLCLLEVQWVCGCWWGSPGSTWRGWRLRTGRSEPSPHLCTAAGPAHQSDQDPAGQKPFRFSFLHHCYNATTLINHKYSACMHPFLNPGRHCSDDLLHEQPDCRLTEGPWTPLGPARPLTPGSPIAPRSPLVPGIPGGPTGPGTPLRPSAPFSPRCRKRKHERSGLSDHIKMLKNLLILILFKKDLIYPLNPQSSSLFYTWNLSFQRHSEAVVVTLKFMCL